MSFSHFCHNMIVAKTTAPLPHLLATVALALLLTTAACDSDDPSDEPPPCNVLSECVTLDGISQLLGHLYPSAAVAGDDNLYVALYSNTDIDAFTYDSSNVYEGEVYVLSKPLDAGGNPETDSTWRIEKISRSPETMSGDQRGAPTLSLDADGQVHLLWGEMIPFNLDVTPDVIMYATGRRGSWSAPQLAYDMPVDFSHLSGGALPARMARGADGRLHATFRNPGSSIRGRIQLMTLQSGGTWSAPQAILSEDSQHPYLAGTDDGTLLLSYLRLPTPHEDTPTGLFFVKSSDGGQSWTDPKKIMPLGITAQNSFVKVGAPRVVEGHAGTYHVLFGYDLGNDEADGNDPFNDEVWHSYSTDEGQTWSEPQPVNRSDRGDVFPIEVVATPDRRVHVVYYQTPQFGDIAGTARHAVWNAQDYDWQQQPDIFEEGIFYSGRVGLGVAAGPDGCLHVTWDEVIDFNDAEPAESETRLRYRRVCS